MFKSSIKFCPNCGESGSIHYTTIPESKTTYKQDGERHTIHNGVSHNFECDNCETEWTMYGDLNV
jgi:hypothetical protein